MKFLGKLVHAAIFAGALAGFSPSASAQPCSEDPQAFVQVLGDRVIETLGDASLDDAARRVILRDVFLEFVAVDVVGQVVLGRFWPQTSEAQRAAYFDVFPDYISRFYAGQVVNLPDTRVEVVGAESFGDNDQLVTLHFHLPDRAPVAARFRVRCIDGEQKLLDAMVEGVSLLVTKRDEFVSFLRRNDFETLLEFLRGAQ